MSQPALPLIASIAPSCESPKGAPNLQTPILRWLGALMSGPAEILSEAYRRASSCSALS